MAEKDLHGFIEDVTGESHLRVEEDLGGGFVRLRTSEAERRQAQQDIRCVEDAVLELLRNARDAGAHAIYVATGRAGAERHVTVIDDGEGIPQNLWEAVFEPRVTSKLETFHADQWGVHGRGMALFSIKCNSSKAYVVDSAPGKGSAISVVADVSKLPEKTDQSSLPRLVVEDDGRTVVRGPRNINRIVAEFTLNQKGSCLVFLGSDAEVLATLLAYGERALGAAERALASNSEDYPLCLRPALAADPTELAETAQRLGLSLSSRNARRVMDGEVRPLKPFVALLDQALSTKPGQQRPTRKQAAVQGRKIAMDESDLDAFTQQVASAYRTLAEHYYLDGNVAPELRISRSGLTIQIPFVESD